MSRLITSLGALTPEITNAVPVIEFDASKPESLGVFELEGYPWLYKATGENSAQVAGAVKTQIRNINGEWVDVWQVPTGEGDQETINEELQYITRQHEVDGYNLPVLKEIINGVLYMYCKQTPDNFKDIALTSVDKYGDFLVLNVDENARTITVQGRRYDRTKPANDNSYQSGSYMGFDRFLRDELTGTPAIDLSWKRRQYDYAWINVQPNLGDGVNNKKVKYTSIVDHTPVDVPLDGDEFVAETSTHTLTIAEGEMSSTDWANLAAGGVIKLFRRLPWISPMLATGGNFSQKYFISEFVLKIDNHSEQFFSLWFWANYLKFFDYNFTEFFDIDNNPLYDYTDEQTNGSELDGLEWPGGGDWYTKYHNLHQAGDIDMGDYAARNGIAPVMPNHGPEWNKAKTCEHLVAIEKASQDFIDYGEFFKIRVSWLPPFHERNPRSVGVVIWDIGPEDGPMKFLCGCIAPPHWDTEEGLPKQVFINNAVGGTFVNNVRHIYAKGLTSLKNSTTIVNQLKSMKIWQVLGQVKGGSGYPDYQSKMSRGFGVSKFDSTGNSGKGVVTSLDVIDGGYDPDPDDSNPPNNDNVIVDDGDIITVVDPSVNRIRILIKPNVGNSGDVINNTTIINNNDNDITTGRTTYEDIQSKGHPDGYIPDTDYFDNRQWDDYHYMNWFDIEAIYCKSLEAQGWIQVIRNVKTKDRSGEHVLNLLPYAGTYNTKPLPLSSSDVIEFKNDEWFTPRNGSTIDVLRDINDDPIWYYTNNSQFGGVESLDPEVQALLLKIQNITNANADTLRYGLSFAILKIVAGSGTNGTEFSNMYLAVNGNFTEFTPSDAENLLTYAAWMKLASGKLTFSSYNELHVDGVEHTGNDYYTESNEWQHFSLFRDFNYGYLSGSFPGLFMEPGSELLIAMPVVMPGEHVIEPHTKPVSSYPGITANNSNNIEYEIDAVVSQSTTFNSQAATYGVVITNTEVETVQTIVEGLPLNTERTFMRKANTSLAKVYVGDGNTELIESYNWINLNATNAFVTIKKTAVNYWEIVKQSSSSATVLHSLDISDDHTVIGSTTLNVDTTSDVVIITLNNAQMEVNDEVAIAFYASSSPLKDVAIVSSDGGAEFYSVNEEAGDSVILSALGYVRYRKTADNVFKAVRQYLFDYVDGGYGFIATPTFTGNTTVEAHHVASGLYTINVDASGGDVTVTFDDSAIPETAEIEVNFSDSTGVNSCILASDEAAATFTEIDGTTGTTVSVDIPATFRFRKIGTNSYKCYKHINFI